ncbi:hypothetical protein SAMN04489761_3018 [Tenacibaculum sp. MAR_2009_124]|uniref:hypothetical protein n=1 Tax=Tenacibaculum sp. MAR_2009_124 TaxID=1250059 RepID=UPI00089BD21C|nr:hypothetical protein [Tenacibaculum sp. MAR_2009_124]SEC44752.1 hypothetical protein SAMN04489761_3018 [Tenacibaculum sp. MAR_2009_124]
MIKYEIKTGSAFLNEKARNQRDLAYKPELKGMRCNSCSSDTIVRFVESDLKYVKAEIHSCCSTFDMRIRQKLWPNKN